MEFKNTSTLSVVLPSADKSFSFLFKDLMSELKRRSRQTLMQHWIAERVHLFILQRAGVKEIEKTVRNKVYGILMSVERNQLLKHCGTVRITIKINEYFRMFLHKDAINDGPTLTVEFTTEQAGAAITYQIVFKHYEGCLQEILGIKKKDSSQPLLVNRFCATVPAQDNLKVISQLLRENLEIRCPEVVISTPLAAPITQSKHIKKITPRRSFEIGEDRSVVSCNLN